MERLRLGVAVDRKMYTVRCHMPKSVGSICVIASLSILAFIAIHGPQTSADIRLDTGDTRVRYLGIPSTYHRMPEPFRSRLLALSSGSRVATPDWWWYESYPRRSGQFNEYRPEDYAAVAIWADADPQLARLMLEDLAADIRNGHRTYWHTLAFFSERFIVAGTDNRPAVTPNWRSDPALVAYMASKAYTPPAARSAVTLPSAAKGP